MPFKRNLETGQVTLAKRGHPRLSTGTIIDEQLYVGLEQGRYTEGLKQSIIRSTNHERYTQNINDNLARLKKEHFDASSHEVSPDEFLEQLQAYRPAEIISPEIMTYFRQVIAKLTEVQYTELLQIIDVANATLQLAMQPTLIMVSSVASYVASLAILSSPTAFRQVVETIKKQLKQNLMGLNIYKTIRSYATSMPRNMLIYSSALLVTMAAPFAINYFLRPEALPEESSSPHTENRRVTLNTQDRRIGGIFSDMVDEVADLGGKLSTEMSILVSGVMGEPLRRTLTQAISFLAPLLGIEVVPEEDPTNPPMNSAETGKGPTETDEKERD